MPKFNDVRDARSYLESWFLPKQGFQKLCSVVVNDKKFAEWPASISKHANPQHHTEGGLLIHTAEVVRNAHRAADSTYDREVLITAAIWHDYGKLCEYRRKEDGTGWEVDEDFRARIGHPAASAATFSTAASLLNFFDPKIDHIVHCILSHHGRIEWGAVKEPQTKEAVLLHTADYLSARF